MEELKNALSIVNRYEEMSIEDFVSEFSNFTNQSIDPQIISEFRYTGLSNIDFATSNFLLLRGYKNIYNAG